MNNNNERIVNLAATLGILALIIYTCVIAKALLIPFVCAVVIWHLTVQLSESMQKITVNKWNMLFSVALTFSLILSLLFVYFLYASLTHSINNIISDAPKYQEKMLAFFHTVEGWTGREIDTSKLFSNVNLTDYISMAAFTLTSLAGSVLLIIIYVIFLIIEYKTFDVKIRALCSTDAKYKKVKAVLERIRSDISAYLKIKTAMSILTGLLSYLILISFGLRNAEFWAIFIFLMNYIPVVGSIVSIVLTLLAMAVQFTSLVMLLVLAGLLTAVHVLVGNLIEPKYMGMHLNLSPLVILLSLAIWGSIWGVIGMLLCVPGMTMINIVLANFQGTRPIAILLSADGKI